jgi:hypothetical protein
MEIKKKIVIFARLYWRVETRYQPFIQQVRTFVGARQEVLLVQFLKHYLDA